MMYSTKSARVSAAWSGVTNYTLTGTAVASDAIETPFAKRFTVYAYYTAGAAETANTADLTVEFNPYDSSEDPTGVYWSQVGLYTNTSGARTEEPATWSIAQATAGVQKNGVPIYFDLNVDAARIRIKAKETGVNANYGKLKVEVVKNEIT